MILGKTDYDLLQSTTGAILALRIPNLWVLLNCLGVGLAP